MIKIICHKNKSMLISCFFNFFIKIKLLLVVYLLLIFGFSYARIELEDNDNTLKSENLLRKDFMSKKELIDLYFYLYRIKSLDGKYRISAAQDPKGYIVSKHNNTYCSPQVNQGCKVDSTAFIHGDMRINGLLAVDTFTSDEMKLYFEVVEHIVNHLPSNIALDMLSASEIEKQLPQNKEDLANEVISQTRLGLPRNSFNNSYFERTPIFNYYADNNINDDKNKEKKLSKINIMDQEVNSRFSNKEWLDFINKADNETLNKELAKMQSFSIWLKVQKYKQAERRELLLATSVAQQETIIKLLTELNAQRKRT